jgi:hypothetical protein
MSVTGVSEAHLAKAASLVAVGLERVKKTGDRLPHALAITN